MGSNTNPLRLIYGLVFIENVKASLSQKECENLPSARMYEIIGKNQLVENALYNLNYFRKILKENNLCFPCLQKIIFKLRIWYCEKNLLGKNDLGAMMKNISQDVKGCQVFPRITAFEYNNDFKPYMYTKAT